MLACRCSESNGRNDSASMIPLKDGRLLLAWSEYTSRSGGDVAPARIGGIVSEDEGRTWSDRTVLQEGHEGGSAYSTGLLRMNNGDVGLFYCHSNRVPERPDDEADVHVRFKRSTDEGTGWTESTRVSSEKEEVVLFHNDRALTLSTGRILAPVTIVRRRPGQPNYEGAVVYYSDDDGATWQTSRDEVATPGDPRGSCEPCAVELRDGSLLMLLRDASGVLHESRSRDGAETWSTPAPTELAAHNSPMIVKRIRDTGDLCLIWNQAGEQEVLDGLSRVRVTAAVSRDEGRTWPLRRNLVGHPLDRRAHIDPPTDLFYKFPNDSADRDNRHAAVWAKLAEKGSAAAPVYGHSSYPSLLFFGGKMFATHDTYGRRSPKDAPMGLTVRVLPVSWLYGA